MKELTKDIIGLIIIILFFFIVGSIITPYEPSPKEGLGTFDNYDGHL